MGNLHFRFGQSALRWRALIGALALLVLALAWFARPVLAQNWERGRWTAPPDVSGLNDTVLTMTFDKNQNMYVGGYFTYAGGSNNGNHIAKWDGKQWVALGSGFNKSVQAIVTDSKGNVYAGGLFRTSGDTKTPMSYIAKWDGTQWNQLAYGLDGNVLTLAVDTQDNVYVGGDFQNACRDTNCSQSTPLMHIARWNGTAWESLGNGMDKSVNTVALDARGTLYAGGDFSHSGLGIGDFLHIAKWDGKAWNSMGGGVSGSLLPTVHSIAVDGIGNVYVAGRFALAGKVFAGRVAKWDGTQWTPLEQGTNYATYSLAADSNGAIYAGGLFTQAGKTDANHVAKWDPRSQSWLGLGGGLDNTVFAFSISPQYVLFAGGDFLDADGDPNADRVAEWNTKTALNTP